MDGGAWWATVHGLAKSRTRLHFHFHFSLSCIGEGNGNLLQCSCLENPRDRGAWWAAIFGVAESRTRLKRLSSSSSGFSYLADAIIVKVSINLLFISLFCHIMRHVGSYFPSEGLNSCSLHWKHGVLRPDCQGTPSTSLFAWCFSSQWWLAAWIFILLGGCKMVLFEFIISSLFIS